MVGLKPIDWDNPPIYRVDSKWAFSLELDETATLLWKKAFLQEWENVLYVKKPKLRLILTSLILEDDLDGPWDTHIDHIKECMKAADEEVRQIVKAKMEEQEKERREMQEAISKIKEKLKGKL